MNEIARDDDAGAASDLTALSLALANATLTLMVLVSPVGLGQGGGVIGYSIYRLLAFVLQSLLAAAGLVRGARALGARRPVPWGAVAIHVVVIVATFFLYFDQGSTICRLMAC